MLSQLLFLFLAAIVTAVLYPIWINFVYKYHMGEEIRDDGPKTHEIKRGTPTMGGFVFILAVSLITFLFNRSRNQTLFPIFVASMAGLFGILEDFSKIYKSAGLHMMRNTHFIPAFIKKPWELFKEWARIIGSSGDTGFQTYQKFLIQFVIAGFVSYWTYIKLGWDYIWFPLVGDVHIGVLYPIVLFILFIAVMNFVAFTDGIDGLAGGLGLISFSALWVLANILGYNSIGSLSATFVGALLLFLYFNVYPARIFMGNVGSHVLGATLTVLAAVMHREVALIFICGMFIIDGLSSPLQQLSVKLTKKRLFRMAPIHHHFEMLGWPETKVTLRFWIFGALLSFLGIFVALL